MWYSIYTYCGVEKPCVYYNRTYYKFFLCGTKANTAAATEIISLNIFCLLYMGWENVTSYESCGLRQKTFDMCVLKLIMLMVETKPIWYIFRPSNEISWHAICRNYEKFNVIIRGYHLIEKLFDINFINIYYLLQQPKQESDIKIGIKLISLLTLICARNITQTISWDKFDLILQWAIDLSLTFVTCTQ